MTDSSSSPVAEIAWRRLALPLDIEPVLLAGGQLSATALPTMVVRLTDSDGGVGWSALWAQQARQLDLFEAGLRYLAPHVLGRRVDDLPSPVPAMRASLPFMGPDGVLAFALSAYEMAIEDLACRRCGIGIAQQVGRVRDRAPAYQTGLMLSSGVDEIVAEAKDIYDSGVRAIKMVVGKATVEEDVDRLDAVRSSLPPDARLMVDAFQRWDVPTALRAAERFAPFDLVWMEDPLAHADIAGYRKLAPVSPVPIATGEGLFSRAQFQEIIDAGVPYVVAELERVGGVRPWLRLVDLARSGGATLLPHINPHVSAQLVATMQQPQVWWEYVPWFDELAGGGFEIVDGHVQISDAPGCGLTPDDDAIERLSSAPWTTLRN